MTVTNTSQRTFRGIPVTQGSLVDMIFELRDGLVTFIVMALVGFAVLLATISGLLILVILFVMGAMLLETVTAKNHPMDDDLVILADN